MRRLALAATLFLAGCASRPQQPAAQVAAPTTISREARQLLGLTPNEAAAHLGRPVLQISEGNSLKLQFRGRTCVLDAYFYPSNGMLRLTHVDTRAPSGVSFDQAACVLALESGS